MDKKVIQGIIAGIDEDMIVGEIVNAAGDQMIRVMRHYTLKFFAYPDTTDGIMNDLYRGNIMGAPVEITISKLKEEE